MAAVETDRLVRGLKDALESRAEVLEAYLFGSRARGTARQDSDIDVAVRVDPNRGEAASLGCAAELGALLSAALHENRIDVVVLNEAPPLLYHRVLRDGIRLFARDLAATTTREGRALSRWCDFVPQLRKIDAAQSRRIRSGGFGR